jgi:predicted nucleic acid-binding Zn ribbon protein
MLRLSQAIVAWTPAEKIALRDPLMLLQAGWTDIVGVEVAANSEPVRVADGTLVVVTRSSAWSHQLSFLADRVLAAVAARLPAGTLYVTRHITGALVGRQPFGGNRLSGDGAQAGGPDYVLQFVEPRVVTENTMRHGLPIS